MKSHLFDFFTSAHWAMEPAVFDQMRGMLERHVQGEKLSAEQIMAVIGRAPQTPNPRNRAYEIHQGIAIVPVNGVLSKHSAGVNDISQPEGTSAEELQDMLRCALADDQVQSVMLHIESPGGQVDGTAATAACVAMVAKTKPVWAFADGLCASAAYYIASAANRICATASAQTGSIGVLAVLRDTSKADEKAGMRTVVVRSGPQKALGQRGEELTNEATSGMQRIVDGLAQQFYDAVSENRQLTDEQMATVKSGQVYLAKEAMSLGLVDEICTFEDCLAAMTEPSKRAGNKPLKRDGSQSPPKAQLLDAPATHHRRDQAGSHPRETMKIAPDRLATLVAENSAHAVLITRMAAGSSTAEAATEADILAAIHAEDHKHTKTRVTELTAQVAEAQTQLTEQKNDHAAALVGKDAEITTLRAKVAEHETTITALKAGNRPLNGGGVADPPAANSTPTSKDPRIAAYDAKVEELKKAGNKQPSATIAKQFPDLRLGMVEAQAEIAAKKGKG